MVENYIGIDVGSKRLDLSFLQNGYPASTLLPNNVSAISAWASQLGATDHCVFEATGVYSRNLEYVLSERNLAFSKVNPSKIKGFMSASGKPPKVAKVAVMHQLVRWAFAVVKSGKVYDPEIDKSFSKKTDKI